MICCLAVRIWAQGQPCYFFVDFCGKSQVFVSRTVCVFGNWTSWQLPFIPMMKSRNTSWLALTHCYTLAEKSTFVGPLYSTGALQTMKIQKCTHIYHTISHDRKVCNLIMWPKSALLSIVNCYLLTVALGLRWPRLPKNILSAILEAVCNVL